MATYILYGWAVALLGITAGFILGALGILRYFGAKEVQDVSLTKRISGLEGLTDRLRLGYNDLLDRVDHWQKRTSKRVRDEAEHIEPENGELTRSELKARFRDQLRGRRGGLLQERH